MRWKICNDVSIGVYERDVCGGVLWIVPKLMIWGGRRGGRHCEFLAVDVILSTLPKMNNLSGSLDFCGCPWGAAKKGRSFQEILDRKGMPCEAPSMGSR